VKSAVGFTLPSAGVTPAPGDKKDAEIRPCSKGFEGGPIYYLTQLSFEDGKARRVLLAETFRFDLRTNCGIKLAVVFLIGLAVKGFWVNGY
jgi:hypothetical protein